LNAKAIIVAGGGPDAPGGIWEETKVAANKAYDVLIQQGYDHESVYYLSMEAENQYVDRASLNVFLNDAISNWASDASELLLFFVDHGEPDNFILYADGDYTQKLSAQELDGWLDDLQTGPMTGPVTLIYDACESGSFVSKLRPPPEKVRHIITSASNEPAYFLNEGIESFSFQFWDKILLNEGNVGTAFSEAGNIMQGYQTALIDADGNGIANEDNDLILAGNNVIKRGSPSYITIHPLVGSISVGNLSGVSAEISAGGVIDADSVWAQIIPPDINPETAGIPITDLPAIELTDPDEDGVYTGTYDDQGEYEGFDKNGTYIIIVKAVKSQEIYSYVAGAMTIQNFYSPPVHTSVTQANGILNIEADSYEEDDASAQASVIFVNDVDPQSHNFHDIGDEDWVQFYGISGKTYKIKAGNLSVVCDAVIEVYNGDSSPRPEGPQNNAGTGEDEFIDWTCPQDGIYYVRVSNFNDNFGENVKYDLRVYHPVGGVGTVVGRVKDISTNGIDGVKVASNIGGAYTYTLGGGWYTLELVSGTHILTATMTGFTPQVLSVAVNDGNYLPDRNFSMPVADTTAPTATISYSTTAPTNQNVVATLNPSESVTVTNNGALTTRTFTENGSFTFEFEDAAGNTGSATATVSNIDKTAPTYTLAYVPATLTNQNVVATITLSDGTVTSAGGNTHTFTENGTFTFAFIDAAGNAGTAVAMVNWIDITPPTATITYSTTAPTNQDVIAVLVPDEPIWVTNNGGSTTRTFTENGSFTFEFVDTAGNTGSATATVNNIGIVNPGDVNDDGDINLSDLILSLQSLIGLETPAINDASDVNGDDKIGMEEVIYIMQAIAGIR